LNENIFNTFFVPGMRERAYLDPREKEHWETLVKSQCVNKIIGKAQHARALDSI
jgi:hypothetical protein